MRTLIIFLALGLISLGRLPGYAAEGPLDKTVSVNSQGADLASVLHALGQQAGVVITVRSDVTGKLTYGATNVTLKQALDEISAENRLQYVLADDDMIIVRKAGASTPAGSVAPAAAPAEGAGEVHQIPLRFANVKDTVSKVSAIMTGGEKVLADELTNSLIFVGSPESLARARDLVAFLDVAPSQILIQGLIIETSDSYLQDVGFSWGDSTRTATGNGTVTTAYARTAGPSAPNFGLLVGAIDGRKLAMSLTAAESSGDAKVLSRPKVVTLNNQPAQINSGLSIHVKTLSSVQSGASGQSATAVTGGISSINAGLMVNITPTIVGDGEVKLLLSINSSSPDQSSGVDGIPGVQTNSASTTVIVKDGRTAIIAGLIKQAKGDTHDGVPILRDIPVLGYLFQSHSKTDKNNELAIFITPRILGASATADALYPEPPKPAEVMKRAETRQPSRW